MKVLHITPCVEPEVGGIATFTSRLVEGLTLRGHECSVIAAHGRLQLPDISLDGVAPVHRLPFYQAIEKRNPGQILQCKLRASAIKRAFAPDVVHLHIGGPMAFLHLSTEAVARAPLAVTVYDLPPVGLSDSLRQAIAKASRLAAISGVRLADVCREVPTASACSRVIYPVLPFSTDSASEIARGPVPLLLTGGRLVSEKGFAVAMEALALVRQSRPGAQLVITGDGPDRETLEQRRSALGLEDAIHFTGRLSPDDLAAWRRRAWIVLVPTLASESFGLVALEAMHAGRPVVASRLEGLTEVVADGETGRLVPSGDAPALAAAIVAIVSDEHAMDRMGAAGLARARTRFDWTRCLDDYEALLTEARA